MPPVRSTTGQSLAALPELNLFLFAVLLNFPWEIIQAPLFEGMADARHATATWVCARAAMGDGVIMVLAYWVAAAVGSGRRWFAHPSPREWFAFLATGLVVTILLEQLATTWNGEGWGWRYSDAMPLLPLIGTGLAPMAQWLVLPPIALWLVQRQLRGAAR